MVGSTATVTVNLVCTSGGGEPPPPPPPPLSGGFNITLEYGPNITDNQKTVFEAAATRWSLLITGDIPDITPNKAAGACGQGEPSLTAGYALSDRASCRGMAHSTDLRERIINAVIHKRYTLQKAADTFDVGAATVSRYLRRYRQTGEISPPEPPQVAPALSMSTRPGLSRASSATTSPTTSAATCCSTKLASASAEPPGAAGYRDWDRREKKTIYASEQGPEARWRYLAWIQQIDPHRSVFVDESGFNLAMTLPYAYAPGDNVPWVGCRRAAARGLTQLG